MTASLDYAWRRFLRTMIGGGVFLGLWILLRLYGPVIEETWFPIIGDAHVVDTKAGPDGATLFRYAYFKHRDCQLTSYAWYYSDKGVTAPADITRSGQTPSRPTGPNISVWWRIGPGEVLPGTYLIVLAYDCGWPWTSRATMGPFELAPVRPNL